MAGSLQALIFLSILQNYAIGTRFEGLRLVSKSGCGYSGESLIYECTVMGDPGGATVWTGSAFDCRSNEIVLLHQFFTDSDGISRQCNNGAIVGRSLSVEGNLYTSQLNVTITHDMAGKTIMCAYDIMSGIASDLFIISTIPIIPGPFPPPNTFYISRANFISREFTFNWSPVAPDCPAVHYNILTSNCGSCPTTTNHTTVTCAEVPTNTSMCIFAVQTVVCGNITGNKSDQILIYYKEISESGTDTVYVALISFLVIALIACIAVSTSVIVFISIRNKANIVHLVNKVRRSAKETDSMYVDVGTAQLPPVSAISTHDNIAYGHAQTATATAL